MRQRSTISPAVLSNDVRAALVEAFGAQTVADWELLGKAREAQRRKAKRNG